MQFGKLSHGDIPLQRISRSTFDPRSVEYRDVNQKKLDHLILCVRHIQACNIFGVMARLTLMMSHCRVM